jgi:outer membrane receptor protein involved in Fe transport
MKIIYALIAACLSLQACNNSAPTSSAAVTANELAAAWQYEDDPAIVAAAPVTATDGVYVDDFGYTATVTTPRPIETDLGFYIDEDGEIVYHFITTPPETEAPPWP